MATFFFLNKSFIFLEVNNYFIFSTAQFLSFIFSRYFNICLVCLHKYAEIQSYKVSPWGYTWQHLPSLVQIEILHHLLFWFISLPHLWSKSSRSFLRKDTLAKFFKVLACLKMSFFLFFHLNDNSSGYGIFLYYLEDIYPLFSKDPYYYWVVWW